MALEPTAREKPLSIVRRAIFGEFIESALVILFDIGSLINSPLRIHNTIAVERFRFVGVRNLYSQIFCILRYY